MTRCAVFARTCLRMGLMCTAVVIGSCVEPSPVATGPDAPLVFLVQKSGTDTMEAEFRGRVEVDQAGCFRLADDEPSTVIWPFGSTLARDNASLIILEAGGAHLARVGELLRLGGGVVSDLAALEVLENDMLQAALERCPGSYWLVGEVQ